MIVCSVVAGTVVFFRLPAPRADVELWTFADLHARMYRDRGRGRSLLEVFQERTGKSARLDLISGPALDVRLLSLFMFDQRGGEGGGGDGGSPDVVELSLNSIGKYFRPPVEEIGFLPLNSYLKQSGWMNRIVRSRFSPWSKEGVIFGIPHDLHPCTLSYRKDLFDEAGVDLESAVTWGEFRWDALRFEKYWQERGHPRMAVGLSSSAADMLLVMLHQQRVELVDSQLGLHFTDAKVVKTLAWYAEAVGGAERIGGDLNPGAGQSSAGLGSGEIGSLITPDWMVADLKEYTPELAGKVRMMRLPKFSGEDAGSASWSGTMIGITRSCRHPDLAWKLIETLYLDRESLKERQELSGILPPIPEYWNDPVYHQADAYYGNQRIDELYIELAGELPDIQMTAYTGEAQVFLTIALNGAVRAARGESGKALEEDCLRLLEQAQGRLGAMIRFGG